MAETYQNGNVMVDEYKVSDLKGNLIGKIFVCPYHKRISKKAPRGFAIQHS
jgi:hypothetical protein